MDIKLTDEESELMNEINLNSEETTAAPEAQDFESFENDIEDHTQEQTESYFSIPGEMAVELMDVAVSRLSSIGFTAIAKIPNHFQDFQLTADEKKTLGPLIEKWLEHEQFQVNPRTALIGALFTLYGMKGFAVYSRYKQAKSEGKEEELKEQAVKNKGGRPAGVKDSKPRKPRSTKKQNEATNETE